MRRNRNFLWNVSDLPAGDYYIAIQAVDGGRKGGEWSDETVYRHYAETADFIASHSQLSTADTLVVRCAAKGEVTWNCDGGRLISNEAGEVRMMWQTPGTKSLSYSLRTTGGQLVNSQVKLIEVSALGYENTFYGSYGSNYEAFGIRAVDGMDIDGDGVSEIYNYGWWKNDGNDRFKKIALTYNTDLSKLTGIADINSDGFPDFISSYVDKGNVYLNYGEGDLDFDYATYDLGDLAGYSKYMWVDFDNNGALDAYYLPSMDDSGWMTQISRFLNPGNYQNFTKQDWMGTEYHELHTVCDVNRDGMPDIIATGRIGEDLNSYQYNLYIYYKKPGEGFDYEAPKMFFENYSQERGTCMLGDMNNDGYIDLIKQDDSKRNTLLIYEGGPTGGTGVVRELRLIGKEDDDFYHPYLFNLLRDYDNNGYIDIPLMSNDVEYVALMKPGYAYDIEEIDIYARDIFIPAYVKQDQPLIPSGNQKKSIRCGIRNERPAAPGELTVQQTADGILLSWQPGADKETPQCHLRYNVSVKKEGAKGEGAFIISPMNSMKENSTLPSGVWHSNVPQMFIPISCFEAGKNYEVQVQSIDLWEKTSPMTQPLTFMVMEQIQMRMPTDAVLQDEVKVERIGTGNTDAMFEWDGGSIVRQEGNTYYITWATPGVKTVTLTYGDKTYKSQIRIHEPEAIDFALPDNVLAGVPVVWPLPESVRRNPKDFILKASDDKVDVQMNVACDSAIVCFPETGTYQITLQCVAPYKTNTLTREVKVAASMPVPVLEGVGADGSLRWFPAELPEGVSRVEILKESNISGMYIPLDTVAASNLQYTDKDSRGHITPQTYIIRYLADNGQQSHASEPHTTMHLMVCEAMNDGNHLIWTHYKGREVTNYTVKGMRNGIICMEEQVSGTNCSYTVFDSDNDISYYVTASFASDKPIGRAASRSVRADSEIASNRISVQQAVKATVHPTDIQIRSIEQQAVLSEQQPVLHLYTLLLPTSVSVNRVNWTIVSGEQYATINGNGVLSAKNAGSGTVVVKASTVDGSDLSAEFIVKVDDWTGVEVAVADEPVFTIKQQRLGNMIRLSGWMQHEKAFVYVINTNGVAVNISSSSDGTYTLREDDYSTGTYVVVVQQGSRIASSKIFIR